MKLKDDQLRVQELLKETVTLLCKNGLNYKARFSVDALIGVTIDDGEVFLVNIRESVGSEPETSDSEQDSGKKSENAVKAKKRPPDDGHSGVSPSKRSRSANDQDDEYDENDYDDDESNISSAHVKEEPGDDDLVFVKQEHSDFMTTSTPNAFDSQSFHSQNSQPVFSHNRTANMSDPSLINVSQDASWTMNQSASSIDPANLANMSMTQSTSQGGSNQLVCPKCYQMYKAKQPLMFHMWGMHRIGKPIHCSICSKEDFPSMNSYYVHKRLCDSFARKKTGSSVLPNADS